MQPDPSRSRFVLVMVLVSLVALVGVFVANYINNIAALLACGISFLITDLASLIAIRTRRGQLTPAVVISAWIMIDLGAVCVIAMLGWALAQRLFHV